MIIKVYGQPYPDGFFMTRPDLDPFAEFIRKPRGEVYITRWADDWEVQIAWIGRVCTCMCMADAMTIARLIAPLAPGWPDHV